MPAGRSLQLEADSSDSEPEAPFLLGTPRAELSFSSKPEAELSGLQRILAAVTIAADPTTVRMRSQLLYAVAAWGRCVGLRIQIFFSVLEIL